jgi:hypothetical protein
MHKFPINNYKKFIELPLDQFNRLKFSVYIIDFNWNYLFVNDAVKNNLGDRATSLMGKNMWEEFKELAEDSTFILMRKKMEQGITVNMETISPLTRRRLNITGYALEDCYYFSSSILPDKDDLIHDLRNQLGRQK